MGFCLSLVVFFNISSTVGTTIQIPIKNEDDAKYIISQLEEKAQQKIVEFEIRDTIFKVYHHRYMIIKTCKDSDANSKRN